MSSWVVYGANHRSNQINKGTLMYSAHLQGERRGFKMQKKWGRRRAGQNGGTRRGLDEKFRLYIGVSVSFRSQSFIGRVKLRVSEGLIGVVGTLVACASVSTAVDNYNDDNN